MSYDFDTRQAPCDHYQRRERVSISLDDFRTLTSITDEAVKMRGDLTALSSVKLRIGGSYIGQDHPVYGWSVVPDPAVPYEKKYKVVFTRQMRMVGLVIEMEYFSSAASCLKCNGYGKTNDFAKSKRGTFIHLTEHNKLLHRVNKFLLTSRCDFYPQFTSKLKEFIGRKFGLSLTAEDISQECVHALENLRNIQIAQKEVQTLSPQEILRNVESVSSVRDTNDPTLVTTQVSISSYGQDRVAPLTFLLRTSK